MLHRLIMNHTSFYVKVLHNEVVTLDTNEVALLKQDVTIFYAFKTTSKQEKQTDKHLTNVCTFSMLYGSAKP